MRIAVACDHAGFALKKDVIEAVEQAGHEVIDLGTDSPERVDYPDFAEKAGREILSGKADRGVLICGSGVGVCIAANKMKGIYACLCHDTYSAHQGVEHDNMNILCLGSLIIGPALAKELVSAFLSAHFLNKGNYLRRAQKVQGIETRER